MNMTTVEAISSLPCSPFFFVCVCVFSLTCVTHISFAHTYTHAQNLRFFLQLYSSSASNNIIAAKDHASVQINVAEVDPETGRATGNFTSYALCGAIRSMGEADDSLNRLAQDDKILKK